MAVRHLSFYADAYMFPCTEVAVAACLGEGGELATCV